MNLPLDSLVCFHSLDPLLFKGGEVNFDYLTRRGGGGILKIKKVGGSMVQGQVFLKGEGLALFLFNFFKVYHFCI